MILRDDDKPETEVKNVWMFIMTQTQPLIDFYTAEKVLVEVDGTQPMDTVFEAICKILGA